MSEREIAESGADIPQDVWLVAQDVAHDVYEADCQLMEDGESPVNTALVIAKAILAERERCAKIAENRAGLTDYDLEPEAAVAESVTAKSIATSIRQGSPK